MHNELLIFYDNLSVFGQNKNLCVDKIALNRVHQIQEN